SPGAPTASRSAFSSAPPTGARTCSSGSRPSSRAPAHGAGAARPCMREPPGRRWRLSARNNHADLQLAVTMPPLGAADLVLASARLVTPPAPRVPVRLIACGKALRRLELAAGVVRHRQQRRLGHG